MRSLDHSSDWINEEDGCLVFKDNSGKIICNARKLIYPGSNGNPWWDVNSSSHMYRCEQPLTYLIWPIPIVIIRLCLCLISHLCTALYLPTHCEHWYEQIRGGKQWKQCDTVILHLTHSLPFVVGSSWWQTWASTTLSLNWPWWLWKLSSTENFLSVISLYISKNWLKNLANPESCGKMSNLTDSWVLSLLSPNLVSD